MAGAIGGREPSEQCGGGGAMAPTGKREGGRTYRSPRSSDKSGRRRQPLAAWLLLSPSLALYLAFIGIPLVGVIVISFLQWDLVSRRQMGGVSNFKALAHDPQVASSLLNSFLFDIMTTTRAHRPRDGVGPRGDLDPLTRR